MRRVHAVDLMLLGTVLLWSLNITVTKYVLEHGFKPLSYATIRYFAATALFWGFTYSRERSFTIALSDAQARRPRGQPDLRQPDRLRLRPPHLERVDGGADPRHDADLHRDLRDAVRLRARRPPVLGRGALLVHRRRLRRRPATAASPGRSAATCWRSSRLRRWAGYSVTIAPLMRRYSPFRISAVVLALGWVPIAARRRRPDARPGLPLRLGDVARLRASPSSARSS